jgi:hypothetical protein
MYGGAMSSFSFFIVFQSNPKIRNNHQNNKEFNIYQLIILKQQPSPKLQLGGT